MGLIGDGAVIGAGSIVTKDVPPYAVCVGNPARIIKYRFSETVREGLEQIQWWENSVDSLLDIKQDMLGDAESFVEKYLPHSTFIKRTQYDVHSLTNGKVPLLCIFADVDSEFSVYKRVVRQFCEAFQDKSAELILCYHNDDPIETNNINSFLEEIGEWEYDSAFSVLGVNPSEDEAVISQMDGLIMSRTLKNISRVSYAFKYGVKCLPCVDIPLFHTKMVDIIHGLK